MHALRFLSREEFIGKIIDWKNYFDTIMKKKCIHKLQPLFFNYFSENLISSHIQENCQDFINQKDKNLTFMIACKIFQYPNRVLSVRILLVASMPRDSTKDDGKRLFQLSDDEGIDEIKMDKGHENENQGFEDF